MSKLSIIVLALMLNFTLQAQQTDTDTAWKKQYQYTGERINDLQHTKLDVRFDYAKSELHGKAWITLTPHFYPTDSLYLDARGMDIHQVALVNTTGKNAALTYQYNGLGLNIKLNKTYRQGEKYTIYIDYTSKPDPFEEKMGGKLLGVKGLYFINPRGEDSEKPIQIWTQGETESNSVWFPTIDKTNQKSTQEMIMTVPDKYVTLSNGKMISSKKNTDGTRTDYWKMDLPHAPYLFFMGVGDYAVVKDSWRGKEVNYYVEKEYGPVAKKIFGNTPEMMTYFSKITGIDYPWVKYSQITGRDYVAGAMENTTATIHQESAQQDARELVDQNIWEGTIAHELFHQWFGDYVTAENWTNLTLNESFADYSQTLWDEYKYGRDAGDAENYQGMQGYLMSRSESKHLVRFYYKSPEDMFDAVSYQKGGRILHMLRNYVGDSAFFKSLNHYLTTHRFGSAEAHDLRLSFEKITGRDLNWFFNQWYFGSGHPKLDINYSFDAAKNVAMVKVKQTQTGQIFRLPVAIDIWQGGNRSRHKVWIENALDSFYFAVTGKPDLINFDGDKVLLCEKKENKNLQNYIHQYKFGGRYLDRREAIDFFARKTDDPAARTALKDALKDPFHGLRTYALNKLNVNNKNVKGEMEAQLFELAEKDSNRLVKAKAISLLASYKDIKYTPLFKAAVDDSSYSVSGEALEALSALDSLYALTKAKTFAKTKAKGKLEQAINNILIRSGDPAVYTRITERFKRLGLSNEKFEMLQSMQELLTFVTDDDAFRKGVDMIIDFRNSIPEGVKEQTDPYINGMILSSIMNKKKAAGQSAQSDYIQTKISKK